MCALLLWEERRRFLPIWLSPFSGAQLVARYGQWSPRRPDAHDLLVDIVEQSTTGIAALEITNHHNGVFSAQITMEDGAEFDCRPTEAIALSLIMDLPLEVDESILSQQSVWLSEEDADSYFGLHLDAAEELGHSSASGDAKADADFQQLMKDLGVEEKDLLSEQTDVTDGDNEDKDL